MATAVGAPSGATPGINSAAVLIRKVLNYISATINDAELRNLALDGLNAGIHKINTQKIWNGLLGQESITLTEDDADFVVADDFKAPHSLVQISATQGRRDMELDYLDFKSMLLKFPIVTTSGTPFAYSYLEFQGKCIFSRNVSASYISQYPTLQNNYFRRLPEFVDEETVVQMPPDFQWFLIWYARLEVASIRNAAKVQNARSMASDLWNDLLTNDNLTEPNWEIPRRYWR